MPNVEWTVNAMTESNKGERIVRSAGTYPTKRQAVQAAMNLRRKDRHSGILRQGRTYTVAVEH